MLRVRREIPETQVTRAPREQRERLARWDWTAWMGLRVQPGTPELVVRPVLPATPGIQVLRAARGILGRKDWTVLTVLSAQRAQLAVRARQAPQAIPAVRVRPDHRALTV